ncbi:MAG TPA: hypothetical protein VF517_06235 [Thermoleophilaceae bacterium]
MDRSRRIAALACALALPLSAAALAAAQEPAAPAGEPAAPAVDPPAAAPAPDVTAPRLLLGGRRAQHLAPHLEADGSCDEYCEFEISARVYGVPGLRQVDVLTPDKAGEGGARMHFHILVSPRAHRLMNDALRDGRRVAVALNVIAYDLADNQTAGRRWIRVRPPA